MHGEQDIAARPTIAVVIPAWNAGAFIARAVDSALAQSHPADEIIVVDDGSTDDTAEIARSRGATVEVVSVPHEGRSAARNTGSINATSDYVAYLDADDSWDVDKLEIFSRVIEACDAPGVLFSDFRRVLDDTGEKKPLTNTDIFPAAREWETTEHLLDGLLARDFDRVRALDLLLGGYPMYPSALVVNREVLERVGGWNPAFDIAEDLELMIRLTVTAGATYIDRPLTTVHMHSGHGPLYDYEATQLEGDLKVLLHHASASFLSPRNRALVRRHAGLKAIFLGDHARRYSKRMRSFGLYSRALAFPRQWPRVGARLVETALALDRLRPGRWRDLD